MLPTLFYSFPRNCLGLKSPDILVRLEACNPRLEKNYIDSELRSFRNLVIRQNHAQFA